MIWDMHEIWISQQEVARRERRRRAVVHGVEAPDAEVVVVVHEPLGQVGVLVLDGEAEGDGLGGVAGVEGGDGAGRREVDWRGGGGVEQCVVESICLRRQGDLRRRHLEALDRRVDATCALEPYTIRKPLLFLFFSSYLLFSLDWI